MKKHKFTLIDISVPTVGKPFVMHKDSWIICKDGDPKQAVIFDNAALQGNRDHKSIADKHCLHISEVTGWTASVVFMKIYYEPFICPYHN